MPTAHDKIQRYRPLLAHLSPHRRTLLRVLLLLVCGSLLSLANPWMAGLVTASVLGKSATGVPLLLGLWAVLLAGRHLVAFAANYAIGIAAEEMTLRLRSRLYQHLQALPLSYHQQRRSGDTLSLLSTDAAMLSGFVTDTLVQLLPALLTLGGAAALMLWLQPGLALLVLLVLPVMLLAIKLLGRRLRPLSRDWAEANSELVAVVTENLSLIPAIKAFTREGHERNRFESANHHLLAVTRKQLGLSLGLAPLVGFLGAIGLICLIGLGHRGIEAGYLSAPELVSFLLYAMLLLGPLGTLANLYGQVQLGLGCAERMLAFLAESPEPEDRGREEPAQVRGDIRYDSLTFGYPGRPPVLRDFSLHIRAGETLALTGPNGAGKSTLAHLLLRFAEPQGGRISIDGTDIREFSLSGLRRLVGVVSQQVLLLNATIAENIAYGDPAASREEIVNAARAARADEFISALPNGYDTVIGDQGVRLSGGQRQRLSLARTLVKDPPILVLDEATAMFDPAGEEAFIAGSRELLHSRTVILITHRPASLALADRVVELSPP